MKKIIALSLSFSLVSAFISLSAGTVHACSCIEPRSPGESLKEATAVFSGTVVSVAESSERTFAVTFAVKESWKGASTTPLVVTTARDSAACGFNFEQGKTYLVYTSTREDSSLFAGLCGRTHEIVQDDADIAALGTSTPVILSSEPESRTSNPVTTAVVIVLAIVLGFYAARYVKQKP